MTTVPALGDVATQCPGPALLYRVQNPGLVRGLRLRVALLVFGTMPADNIANFQRPIHWVSKSSGLGVEAILLRETWR